MTRELRALRGATTLEQDTIENMCERVGELLEALVVENDLEKTDIVNIFFSATSDIASTFPASAARSACDWLEDIILFGSQELQVDSGKPLCVRVMIQFYLEVSKKETPQKSVKHVYLHGAKDLRKEVK